MNLEKLKLHWIKKIEHKNWESFNLLFNITEWITLPKKLSDKIDVYMTIQKELPKVKKVNLWEYFALQYSKWELYFQDENNILFRVEIKIHKDKFYKKFEEKYWENTENKFKKSLEKTLLELYEIVVEETREKVLK